MRDQQNHQNDSDERMFDGHLEWPLTRMTPAQRLQWLDEAVMLFQIGRRSREESRSRIMRKQCD